MSKHPSFRMKAKLVKISTIREGDVVCTKGVWHLIVDLKKWRGNPQFSDDETTIIKLNHDEHWKLTIQ